jgi:hypothetical protein
MVESVIKTLGHDPEESRVETESELPAWRVRKGSALVTVTIYPHGGDGENHLQVTADVLRLDDKVDRLALYGRLLELNASTVKGAAFGLENGHVVLVSERSTVDLQLSEVKDLVARVEEYADHYDDLLAGEFGGVVAGRV